MKMKTGNQIFLVLAIIALAIAGRFLLAKNEPSEVPTVRVVTNEQVIESEQGSYCWETRGEGVCVDKAAPHELFEIKKSQPVKVAPNETIEFQYSVEPTEVTIQQWQQDFDYITIGTSARFNAPVEKGTYIISSFARFDGGDTTDAIYIVVE